MAGRSILMRSDGSAALPMTTAWDTLPKSVTPALRAFCATISEGQPTFVGSVPAEDAKPGFCFDNVERVIARDEREQVPGWAIWHLPGAYYEAEHHGVWRRPSGDLVDVSPQVNGAKRILFLPDPDAPHDPSSFRSNILALEPGSVNGPRIVELARRRNEILDGYRTPGVVVLNLSFGHQIELMGIMAQLGLLLASLAAENPQPPPQ